MATVCSLGEDPRGVPAPPERGLPGSGPASNYGSDAVTLTRRPARLRLPVGAVVAAAVVLRLPALLADRHLSFDDGVYGASAVAMRDGDLPFREVFSSQGPLFLPLVWLADLAGLRTLDGPRLLSLAAGAVMVAAVAWAVRSLGGSPAAAAGAGALVATSGSVLWVTGPLTSDGPALALAAVAVAAVLAYRRSPSARLALAAGVALGASLAVKSLLVAAAVPVGAALLGNRRHLGLAVASATAVGLATTLPWGFAAVWDQSVAYHLEAAGSRTPVANAAKVASTLLDRDVLLVVVGLAAAAAGIAARNPTSPGGATRLVWAWLAATVAVLLLEHPLWRNHVAHLVPATAILVAAGLDRGTLRRVGAGTAGVAVVAVAAVVVVPYHVAHNRAVLWPPGPTGAEAAARADLAALPGWAISDEPGLVWRSGLRTPADLVDTSVLRIDSGRITAESLAHDAADERVCGVLVWSERFARFGDLPARLDGYREAARYGGVRVLYVKDGC